MNIFVIYLTGIIPAGVIIAVGLHILHTGQEETAKARFFTFLLTTGILLLFAIFTAGWLTPDGDNRLVIIIAPLLTPSLLGVLALILIHIKTFADLTPGGKVIAFLLALSCLALIAGSWQQPTGWAQVILPGSLLLAITWTLASASQKFAALFCLVIILLLTLLNTDILSDLRMQFLPHGFAVILGYFLGMLPGFAVTLAAVFTTSGFRFLKQSTKTVSEGVKPTISTRAVFQLALAAILLGCLAYNILWASIWDQTSDGLGGIFFATEASLVAIGAGMLMELTLVGWRRTVSVSFSVLVPVVMFAAFSIGWGVSYHHLTEERAARIQTAIERYQTRTGSYPIQLGELVPDDLWYIPQPVILRGQSWCYQGGEDYYRLGTYYRESFSSPLSLHIYFSVGMPPSEESPCEAQLPALKALYDPIPYVGNSGYPTITPLPTNP
jgi:hypothetical protein